MHRKPFTCGLRQSTTSARRSLAREDICVPVAAKLELPQPDWSLEKRVVSTKVWGACPPALHFLYLLARKGVGRMKMPKAP